MDQLHPYGQYLNLAHDSHLDGEQMLRDIKFLITADNDTAAKACNELGAAKIFCSVARPRIQDRSMFKDLKFKGDNDKLTLGQKEEMAKRIFYDVH